MPIPDFDSNGLLPSGVYDCSVTEIEDVLGWNSHRRELFEKFKEFFAREVRPLFSEPIYFDGSFVTDKEMPEDIDVVLELAHAPDDRKWQGLLFMRTHQKRLKSEYRVHFWVNLPEANDFCHYFQYTGVKTAKIKGLHPKHLKGILRIG